LAAVDYLPKRNKKTFFVLKWMALALMIGCGLIAFSSLGTAQPNSAAEVVEIKGIARLDRGNVLSELKTGAPLYPGDLIHADKESTILIQWVSDESLVKLSESSELRICESSDGSGDGCVFVTQGLIWGKKEKKGSPFRVKTSLATLGVRGTEFFVKIQPQAHELLVKEGRVVLEKEGVEAGDRTKVVIEPEKMPVFMGVGDAEIEEWTKPFL